MRAFNGSVLCFVFTGASGDGGLFFFPDLVPFFEADRILALLKKLGQVIPKDMTVEDPLQNLYEDSIS
jgi:hypothetical protein